MLSEVNRRWDIVIMPDLCTYFSWIELFCVFLGTVIEGHWNGQVVRDQVRELKSKTLEGFKIKYIFSFPSYLPPHALQKVLLFPVNLFLVHAFICHELWENAFKTSTVKWPNQRQQKSVRSKNKNKKMCSSDARTLESLLRFPGLTKRRRYWLAPLTAQVKRECTWCNSQQRRNAK